MYLVWLAVFWVMQATAQVLFTYGSRHPERWLLGFVFGNVFGASSIWFLMLLYRSMSPNLALGLGTGGGFLCAQVAIALLFRTSIAPLQYVAMAAIAGGMAAFCVGNKG